MIKIDLIYIIPIILGACLLYYLLYSMFSQLFTFYDKISAKRKINNIEKDGKYKYERGSITGIVTTRLSAIHNSQLQNESKRDVDNKNEDLSKEISGETLNKQKIDHLKKFREKYIISLTEEEQAASIRRIYDSDYMKNADPQD